MLDYRCLFASLKLKLRCLDDLVEVFQYVGVVCTVWVCFSAPVFDRVKRRQARKCENSQREGEGKDQVLGWISHCTAHSTGAI